MAELWDNRGIYPGLACVLDYLKFSEAIPYAIQQVSKQAEQKVKDTLFKLIEGKTDSIRGLDVPTKQLNAVRKKWKELEPDERILLRDTLPRFDFQTEQIANILGSPDSVSIYAKPAEINANPYILCEQYVGDGPDDQITFSQIDHGVFPSPELGVEPEFEFDAWQRLRALCVNQLKQIEQHTFLPAQTVLDAVNRRLSFLPEWKRAEFRLRRLETEKDELSGALTFRYEDTALYLYLKSIFEDERTVETTLRKLADRSDIPLRRPVTETNWQRHLTDADSPLYRSHPDEYAQAIAAQVTVCQQIFRRPLSVLCGTAGTGKTTVVKAIINAIETAHGTGTAFQLLAPTGKAADRLREKTGKPAVTIHSFLAQHGWLNDNFTFKQVGGKREDSITTYIIDESSMLDLPLLATLFRAINWNAVQRLIFVGDPNQLPPIGTGKVFADLIDWLRGQAPEHVGELTINMRNKLNQLQGKGTGILDLASLYVRRDVTSTKSADRDAEEEAILHEVKQGDEVRGDLRVIYWNKPEELGKLLQDTISQDMEADLRAAGKTVDSTRPDKLWEGFWNNDPSKQEATPIARSERNQVISPYRGELFGIEHINGILQRHKNAWWLDNKGAVGGITYRDKVIQIINRPESRPIRAYNTETRKSEKVQVFNGEIGITNIHGFDNNKWKWAGFHIEHFQVVFSRKPNLWVDYASQSQVEENLELAYAISVHKAQGSEFERLYFVLPKYKRALLSRELFYTGITRAQVHSTLFVQEDIAPILSLLRPENSYLSRINSSLFQFRPVPAEFQTMSDWYEEGKVHRTLVGYMVRSKSEVIIANMLFDRDIPFKYELPLYAPDGTFYLPDFRINWRGEEFFWEHVGMLHDERYRKHWEIKKRWYDKHFPGRLVSTQESGNLSIDAKDLIDKHFA